MGFYNPHVHVLQVGGYRLVDTTKRQKLTRSLLSGSEKSLSTNSESEGASCDTVLLSKPYMFPSAMDATSAAIDYLKGDIDDSVVDSPSGRGPERTPMCSPLPLKRVSSSQRRSLSPTPRTNGAASRKLQLPLEGAIEHPRLDDVVLSPSMRPAVFEVGVKSTDGVNDERWDPHLGASVGTRLRQVEDNGSHGLQIARPRQLLPTDILFRQRNTREVRLFLGFKSNGSALLYINNVKASLPKPSLRGWKSLSALEVPQATYKSKPKASGSYSLGVCDALDSGSKPQYHSRREDILRGCTKLKAMEAVKSNSTNKSNA